MAGVPVSFGLIILFGSIDISAAKTDCCDIHAAIGIRLRLPFVYERLVNTEKLEWLHNDTVIFQQNKEGKVSVGKPDDICNGSLELKNPKFTSAGIYQAKVYNASGTLIKEWRSFVCIMESVPKPTLKYVCDEKSQAVQLNCYIAKPQDLTYSWTMDEKLLTGETKDTLSMSLSSLKAKHSFSCRVTNRVSHERSATVHPGCKSSSPLQTNLWCFQSKTVMAVLAGGGGLILILFIIIIALCCCQRRNKSLTRRGKEEPRMLSLSKRESEPASPDYETMHTAEICPPPPSPKHSLKASNHNAPGNAPVTEGGSLHLTPATEAQTPSPVPKPRTKRPQTPNV